LFQKKTFEISDTFLQASYSSCHPTNYGRTLEALTLNRRPGVLHPSSITGLLMEAALLPLRWLSIATVIIVAVPADLRGPDLQKKICGKIQV